MRDLSDALEDYRFNRGDVVKVRTTVTINDREVVAWTARGEARILINCSECDEDLIPETYLQHALEFHPG